tara:strand:+ start:514 stop:750 length:237 start_codon:yes stop_codon:yes gene_type:complete
MISIANSLRKSIVLLSVLQRDHCLSNFLTKEYSRYQGDQYFFDILSARSNAEVLELCHNSLYNLMLFHRACFFDADCT